jgi:RNA polymerase sigma factor (sigma-70 family)
VTPSADADGLAAGIYQRHSRPLRAYLRALTGSAAVAEDLAQDVFVRVVRGGDRYEDRRRERAWLFRIARNVAIDHGRRMAARPRDTPAALEAIVPATQPLRVSLQEVLARLPEAERESFLLAELGGLTYDEIGEALQMTPAAVRSCLYRARVTLRAQLVPPAPLGARTAPGETDDD